MSAWSAWGDEARQYVWAVICKNHKVHDRQNISSGHKVPLPTAICSSDAVIPIEHLQVLYRALFRLEFC